METLSADAFKEKYGGMATTQFNPNKKQDSLFSEIKNDISARGAKNSDIMDQPSSGFGDDVTKGFEMAGNSAGAVGDVAGSALSRVPIVGGALNAVGGALKKGFNAVTDKLSDTNFFKEASAGLEPGNNLEKGLKIGAASGEVAGNILGSDVGAGVATKGAKVAGEVPGAVASAAEKIPTPNLGKMGGQVAGAVRDVIPTKQSLIDHNIAKALDLTPGDLSNIEKSTGNGVGQFLADNNLIGTNKETTLGLVNGFFKQNYDAVRQAISQVPTEYKMNQIPRYFDALKQIEKNVTGVPGLEKTAVEVDNLLNKDKITLNDVQRVKELMDEHFNLYKATGDVGQGAAKEGLATMRQTLRQFIESEVKKNTGANIRQMNNNVATAKTLGDAVETRSTRGLTRANITSRDVMMGMGLTYFASPLVGLAGVLIKKVATSPTVRLRVARYLDKLSDAEKAKVSESLKNGEVPKALELVAAE